MHALQDQLVALTGHEAALFCISGTMSNQVTTLSFKCLSLTVSASYSDTFKAAAVFCSLPPASPCVSLRSLWHLFSQRYLPAIICIVINKQGAAVIPVNAEKSSNLTLRDVQKHSILDDDVHYAPTKLISLENTMNGEVFNSLTSFLITF